MRRLKLLLLSVPLVLVFTVSAQCANLRASAPVPALHASAVQGSFRAPVVPAETPAPPASTATGALAGPVPSAPLHEGGQGDAVGVGAHGPGAGDADAAPKAAARKTTRRTAEVRNKPVGTPGPTADAAAEPSALYDLKLEATPKVDKGGKGAVRARIFPRAGAHLSDEAPVTLTLSAPPSLGLAKKTATKADVSYAGGGGSLELPFEALESGKAVIEAKLKFYICTDKTCAQQERTASLPVTVR
jgi:hypothetical protein